jgi:cytochrome c556
LPGGQLAVIHVESPLTRQEKFMRIVIAATLTAFTVALAGSAIGQDSAIPARQDLMKMNGAAAKAAFNMAKGATPFVAADAAEAMKIIKDNMIEFPSLFPVGGEDDGDTRALPKIWEDMDGFKAASEKAAADAAAAEAAAANGLDAFKAALGAVGANCGSCHETYRGPKKS